MHLTKDFQFESKEKREKSGDASKSFELIKLWSVVHWAQRKNENVLL